jgi:uncharacterized RmlC-like cupin family protein
MKMPGLPPHTVPLLRRRSTVALVLALFPVSATLAGQALEPRRLGPDDIAVLVQGAAGAGTSGLAGIQSTVLAGNPATSGIYTIRLMVPPHQKIQAHRHRDPRTAVVVAGHWRIGYGDSFDAKALKTLAPGSFYTEPAGAAHFAETDYEAVVIYITGFGPTDTQYLR